MTEQILFEQARKRIGYDRARAFGAPVLRSLSTDVLLVGYSITSSGDTDAMVEANHVILSSLSGDHPTGFTTRTWKTWSDRDVEHYFHALDQMTNFSPVGRRPPATQRERDDLLAELRDAPRFHTIIAVDGGEVPASAFTFEGVTFALLEDYESGALVSVAGPTAIVSEGFSSTVD